jgi:hypothetical protein
VTEERQGSRWIIGVVVLAVVGAAIVYVVAYGSDLTGGGSDTEWSDRPVASRPNGEESGSQVGLGQGVNGAGETEDERLAALRERIAARGPLVRMVGDGGVPIAARPVLTHRPGTLIRRDPNNPQAPPELIDGPVRTAETPPEVQLQRVRAVLAGLDQRQTALTEQRAEAAAAGNTERVAHIDRQLEIIGIQRPAVLNRIADLERQNSGG